MRSESYARHASKCNKARKSDTHVPSAPTDDAEALAILCALLPCAFFLRVDRAGGGGGGGAPSTASAAAATGGARALQLVREQSFDKDGYFAFVIEPDPFKTTLLALCALLVVLAGVMFPLWPYKARVGVYYLSLAVLGLVALFFALAVVRLVVFALTWLALKPGLWIFPNLFEDVGFVDSFVPLWAWNVPPPKKKKSSKHHRDLRRSKKGADDAPATTTATAPPPSSAQPRIVEQESD